ncbi:MAG: hypothetical protein ACK4K7_09920 [Allosphingosinicella sp.]|uniref:hypothetical protein n=1 Tax=Allosphingosinicella sp. TaxID=2823234 RepID=UPI00392E87C7
MARTDSKPIELTEKEIRHVTGGDGTGMMGGGTRQDDGTGFGGGGTRTGGGMGSGN